MVADNKMWEGHRIIYPNLRNEYLENNKISYPKPVWDEQRLEELEYELSQALMNRKPIILTLWSINGPREKEIIALEIKKRGSSIFLIAQEYGKISNIILTDILDITTKT